MQEKILGRRTQCQDFRRVALLYRAYEEYLQEMIKEYGLNFTQDELALGTFA
ncbi:hypothetical protein R6Q59_014250 [Mikania micrantha]